jgi:NAD(P)-dependent dehydrogenase (short-subunit alcohol dehydrogenase family)
MLLENKNTIIYGGGGSIGGSVARTFAREGAHVFLAGRTRKPLDVVAADITAGRGRGRGSFPCLGWSRRYHRHVRQRHQRDVPQLAVAGGRRKERSFL